MIRAFLANERGNMALLFAMAFSLGTIMGAIVVDGAALYHERRLLQAGVDIAALTAARDLSNAEVLARDALVNAGLASALESGSLVVVTGRYSPDPALAPAARFVAGASPPNAVSVSLDHPGRLHLASAISQPPQIAASAVARITPEVSFTIGSRLASLDGGLANAVLGNLLGTQLSLSVMDYRQLAAVRVSALAFLDALAIEMGLDAATYNDLLASTATTGEIAAALADVVDGTESGLLNAIALAGRGNDVPVGRLLALGRFGRLHLHDQTAVLAAELSALEIISAAAAFADGNRQVRLKLTPTLPGISKLDLDLAIGEPAQGGGFFAHGRAGTTIRTAQLRLRLALNVLASAIVSGGVVNLPIWLDVAHAQATLVDAVCPTPTNPRGSARISVVPGIVTMAIGTMNDAQLTNFGPPPPSGWVKLLDAALVSINGSSRVSVAQTTPIIVQFSSEDIAQGRMKTVRTQTMVASLVGSLFTALDLRVELGILGLGLNLNAIAGGLRALLAPLAQPLDQLLNTLLQTLGLGLGEADIRVYGVHCTDAVLVG